MAKTKSGAKGGVAAAQTGKRGGIAALEQSPSHLLHRALQRALDVYVEEFGESGVTQRQFAVLAAADEREGATQADLVRITGIDRSTLADMARRMIAKDLLERERSNVDARANAVRLTDAGRAALADARPKMASADAKLLKLISGGGRRATFLSLLRDLTKTATAEPAKAKAPKAKAAKPAKPTKGGKPHKGGKKAKKKAA
jgi:DNA-binding MarR family transcriptional regulator